MRNFRNSLLVTLFGLFISMSVWASTNYAPLIEDIEQRLDKTAELYQQQHADEARRTVQMAYFEVFENLEGPIRINISARKSYEMESAFGEIRRMIGEKKPLADVQARIDWLKAALREVEPVLDGGHRLVAEEQHNALTQDLQKAVTMLGEGEETQWSLLLYSLMIIVREGLEALLIVAAIVAYMVKNNHQDKLPLIRQSVIVALIASVITAAIFQMLFTNSGASRELLEGITMLIAVVMLFFMSYWLLSKVEARHWKAWLEGKLSHSLSRGSLVGLWLTSFLAVYREGAETVLFYYALIGDANTVSGHMAIGAGFVIGCVVLLLAWLVMRYSVVRLPLKPFFMFTGSFMYLMAFVFAGKGVLELVEGKLFQPTLINGFPEISWLGIYPYVETLLPQVVLLLAALVALWVMRRKSAVPGETIKNNP